jgi:hypothetical protein
MFSIGNPQSVPDEFRIAVLQHINETLGQQEWDRLRSFARNERRHAIRGQAVDLSMSPDTLVQAAVSKDAMTIDEVLTPFKAKAVVVGVVAGKPLFYVAGEGIYVCESTEMPGTVLSVWLTHPAYPPSW